MAKSTHPSFNFLNRLSREKAAEQYKTKDTNKQTITMTMGVLFSRIGDTIEEGETDPKDGKAMTPAKILRAAGVSESSINSGSYASIAYRELAAPGHIDEAEYFTLTWDVLRAVKAGLGLSKKKPVSHELTAETIAEVIKTVPKNADRFAEIESLYNHDMTVAEKAEADEKAEAEAKAEAEKAEAEAEALRKELEELRKSAGESDEDESEPAEPTEPTDEDESEPAEPTDEDEPEPAEPESLSGVDVTDEVLKLLEQVEHGMTTCKVDASRIWNRLAELQEIAEALMEAKPVEPLKEAA